MPQDSETGRQGYENGYERANHIGSLIGATRIGRASNEFTWRERRVAIKTGPSVVLTRSTLSRIDAIVYGYQEQGVWTLYEMAPRRFEELSVSSQSRKHTDDYRLVRRAQFLEHGRELPVDR